MGEKFYNKFKSGWNHVKKPLWWTYQIGSWMLFPSVKATGLEAKLPSNLNVEKEIISNYVPNANYYVTKKDNFNLNKDYLGQRDYYFFSE